MVALTGEATIMQLTFKQAMLVGLVLNGIGLLVMLTTRRSVTKK